MYCLCAHTEQYKNGFVLFEAHVLVRRKDAMKSEGSFVCMVFVLHCNAM